MIWSWRHWLKYTFPDNKIAARMSQRTGRQRARRATPAPQLELLEARIVMSSSAPSGLTGTAIPLYIVRPPGESAQPAIFPWTEPNTGAYGPAALESAYGVSPLIANGDNGAGQTIAVVDAYDDPDFVSSTAPTFSTSDLAEFDQTFGLANPVFEKVSQTGSTTALPPVDPTAPPGGDNWEVEESLDVEWAHAMAPGAKIILVECNSDSFSDLFAGVTWAATPVSQGGGGATVVSMSFGSAGGFSGETAFDSTFSPTAYPGVTFLASADDSGSNGFPLAQAAYPSDSPDVISVGGTNLDVNTTNGSYIGESVWNELAVGAGATGGGISNYESAPAYQQGLVIHDGLGTINANGMRAAPDVALDADPYSGVAVYDSYNGQGPLGAGVNWEAIGGTSLSSPAWGGLIAIADQMRVNDGGTTLTGATQTLPILYSIYNSTAYSQDFNDITVGNNGTYAAGPGYDLDTGIGTPIANNLLPAMAGTLIYDAQSGVNNYRLVESGTTLELFDNGVLVASQQAAETTTVDIGGDTDNSLTIDYSGGVFTANVNFQGGPGTGAHTLTLTGGSFGTETYAPSGANSGTITLGAQTITFTQVGSITDSTTAANYTVDGTSGVDQINVVNGSGGATEVNSGNSTFAKVEFANKADVTINGLTGADVFTVNVSTPEAALTTLNLDGGSTAGVVFNVEDTPAGVVTNVLAQAAATVNIGNAGNAQTIQGTLNLDNTAGPQSVITISDLADSTARTVTLTSSSLSGLTPGLINYVYADTRSLTINGGSGGNSFTISSVGTTLATVVNGGAGSDSFFVSPLAVGTNLTVNGQGFTTLPGNLLSYLGIGTVNPGGTGSGTITQSGQGTVTYTGIQVVKTVVLTPSLSKSTLSALPATLPLGSTDTVTLTVRDANGDQDSTGGLIVTINLAPGSSGGTLSSVTDNGDGTYTALFTTTTLGSDTFTGTIGGQALTSAPPVIVVTPGPVNLSQSTLVASPTSLALDGSSTVTFTARDAFGNQELSGGLVVKFTLASGSAGGTLSSITDHDNGVYTAVFTAGTVAGNDTITATVGGQPVTSTPVITVVPGPFSLLQSSVSVGSATIPVGSPTTVTLTARDAYGNQETSGGLMVNFGLVAGSSGGTFNSVIDDGNGLYTATFTAATTPGSDLITATIGGVPITSQPASILVVPGPASLAQSTISVSSPSVQVGNTVMVTLTARDDFGNQETSGGLSINFFDPSASGQAFSSVTDNGNGTYTAIFTGTVVGDNTLTAAINSRSITTTPSVVDVIPGPVSPLTSTVSVSSTNLPAGSADTVTLTARDAYGNLEVSGGANVVFSLAAGSSGGTLSAVTDEGNGTYVAVFTSSIRGNDTIATTINGQAVTAAAPIVTVTTGLVSLSQSTLTASLTSIPLNGASTLMLTARDAFGNQEPSGGLAITLALAPGSGGGTFSALTDNGNGTYTATFTAGTVAGNDTITATLGGQTFTSMPVITVQPGPFSLLQSSVSVGTASLEAGGSTTVTLTARDAVGNLETSGGLAVNFSLLAGSSGGSLGSVVDNGNGTYVATFTAGSAIGSDSIAGIIGGQFLSSTPAALTVTPGVVSPSESTAAVTTPSISAGDSTTVTLTARDAFGNPETSGGLSVDFVLAPGSSGGTLSGVTDHGNGTYTATFQSTVAGSDTITTLIGGQTVTSVAPTVTVTPGAASPSESTESVSSPSIQVGDSTTVTLTARDAFGNPETSGSLIVAFALAPGSSGATLSGVTDHGNGTYSATFTSTVSGNDTVTATIGGQAVTSAAPSVTVTPLAITPAVVSISSTTPNGTYGAGAVLNITVNFSTAVSLAGGNLIIALNDGGVVTIAPFTNATAASGTYTVSAGQDTAALDSTALSLSAGATLQDAQGENVFLTIPAGQSLSNNAALVIQTSTVVSPPPVPVINPIDPQTVADGSSLSFVVTATAPIVNGSPIPLTFGLASGAPAGAGLAGATINSQTGLFTWTPSEFNGQAPGVYTVIVSAAESNNSQIVGLETVTITVTPSSSDQGSGIDARMTVALGLTQSQEYYSDFVTAAYNRYLGRAPDAAGLAYWVNLMQNGLSDEQLEAGFLSSTEYISDHGGTNANWITGLYVTLLGRTPQQSEVQYWLNQLSNGMTPQQVALGFTTSQEHESEVVAADYEEYLGRSASASEIQYWVNVFENGGSNEQVIAGFISSQAYFQAHGNNIVDWLFASYQAVLQRQPDLGGYLYWENQLQ